MFKRRLIAADQASVFMEMMSVHISSGLVLHQMTSDHNRSELGIHDHSNEPSSSKLVPKVVPLAVKTATSRKTFLHGMNVIACIHDMVDKLAFMAWLLACLCGMDGKVSEIGSMARNDEIKNVKFIDTGSMKEKMKM
ncbi:hypothetical protein Tco_0764320 [Tanacetum coccineum]